MKPVMIAFFLSRDAVREQQDGLNCRSLIPSSGPKQRLRIYFAHVALFVVATVRKVLSLALCRPLAFFLFFFFPFFFAKAVGCTKEHTLAAPLSWPKLTRIVTRQLVISNSMGLEFITKPF